MRRGFAVLLVGASIVLGSAGCGGGSSGSIGASTETTSPPTPAPTAAPPLKAVTPYERKMQALGTWLNGVLFAMGTADRQSNSTPRTDAKNLEAGSDALQYAARRLAQIVPPSNVRVAHDQLRRAVLEYAGELALIAAAAAKGSPPENTTILRLQGLKDMTKASLAIEGKGYNITGPNGG
jgi:hypothetical protein